MNGIRVLIIEDEISVAHFLTSALENNNFEVKHAQNGAEATQFAIEFRPEIIILDLGLPDIDGIEILKSLRKWNDVPIIILTANDSDEDKVYALENGADDYLTKPFKVTELLARFKAILRRSNKTIDDNIIHFNSIDIHLNSHQAFYKKQELKLTQTEFDILKFLIQDAGKVVIHRNLLKKIWGPNSVEHTQYLRVYVGQLRKKLVNCGAPNDIILTETGIGYRLND